MTQEEKNILEDVKKSLEDPVYGVALNYSLEKCEEYYDKRVKQWNNWNIDPYTNPGVKKEEEVIKFNDLADLPRAIEEAKNLLSNLDNMDWVKKARYDVLPHSIRVTRVRLKTFDEWLEEGLKDALERAYTNICADARIYLHNKCGLGWYVWDREIEAFATGLIDYDALKFLHNSQPVKEFEWRDVKNDVQELKRILYDRAEKPTKDVTVLTLKM